jgi:hypothetical protein
MSLALKVFLGVIGLMLLLRILASGGSSPTSSGGTTAPAQNIASAKQISPVPKKSGITKKDGTVDERENDLDELCKDWVFYKARAYKFGREGDQKAAADAQKSFAETNRWLSDYRDEDVTRVCAIYDTQENLAKGMR